MPTLGSADRIPDTKRPIVTTKRPIRPPLPDLAGAVSRDFSIRTSQGELAEFTRVYQREIAKLAKEWIPLGQSKTLPKRLTENLEFFFRDCVVLARNSQPDATKEIRLLLRSIRTAVDRVKATQYERETSKDRKSPLFKKTVTFLKRLAHDKSFDESAHGARKYRKYVIQSKIKTRLKRPIWDEVVHDLPEAWQARRVRSQQELLDIGKSLALCVGRKNEQSRRYFSALVAGKSEFWQLLVDGESKGLFEVHCGSRYIDCPSLKNHRCVGEFNGYSHRFLRLPYQVAGTLVQKLKIHPLSSLPLFNTGAFPSFLNGSKNRDRPDFSIRLDNFRYEVWLAPFELIISRTETIAEGYTATRTATEWGYFLKSNKGICDRSEASEDSIAGTPPRRLKKTHQTLWQHRFSSLSKEEALAVLSAHLMIGAS